MEHPAALDDDGPVLPIEVLDVPCTVEVVLGTALTSLRRCVALEPQDVVRLNDAAGNDLLVRVNGVAIARAEVVVADESTSIRITEIVPPRGPQGLTP